MNQILGGKDAMNQSVSALYPQHLQIPVPQQQSQQQQQTTATTPSTFLGVTPSPSSELTNSKDQDEGSQREFCLQYCTPYVL